VRRLEEVFVLVRRAGEVLVLHRSERKGAYWHSVAGALEDGESWADAAARELEEEVGLVAKPAEVGAPYSYALDAGTPEILVHNFVVDAPAGWEPRLDWEHDEYRWCSREDAIRLLHWPEPKDLLRAL
jgi:lipoyl(octanoyl) transferase